MKRAEAIRKLFLEGREQYSIREAAALVGWSSREVADEIASSELRRVDLGAHVSWRAVAMIAMTVWSYESIEEALGENASVLPPLARLANRTVRLRSSNSLPLKQLRAGRASPSTNFSPGTLRTSCA